MSVTRPTDLFYGHLGEAKYDVDKHTWHFNRVPGITRKITPLGPPLTVLQPSIEQSSLEDIRTAVKRTEGIKKLAQSFPELVPGISCFPELAQESEIIRKTVSRHDPTASSLFAFGKAKDQSYGQTGSRPGAKEVPIIAVAGGSVGHAVRLIRLRKEEAGWERNKSVRLTNFLLKDQEQGWWFTNGSPIQQLCFAESSGKARARVAVRYPGAITVLEPLLQADAVPARSFYDPDVRRTQYPEARLDANPVLTLTTDYTGGSPHADISFNPWHTAQFAVVDQLGHWSIWELKPRTQLRDGKNVDAGPSGFISDECTDEPESFVKADDGDGWGMIMWAGDRSTIIVANRKTLSLFSIEDDNKRLHVPKLFEPKRIDWILDMKRSRLNLAHVFLLTSTRVFWLHIIPGGRLGEGGRESGATILLSWIHFRDQQDISLGLNVLDDEDTTLVVLYSRLTSLSTIFTFSMSQHPLGTPLSISDPYLLPLADSGSKSESNDPQQLSEESPSLSSLELRCVEYQSPRRSNPSGLGALYREKSIRFYHLSAIYSDLSLRQCLYVGQKATDPTDVQLPAVQNRESIFKTPMFISKDGFIVPNRVSAKDWEDPNLDSGPRRGLERRVGRYKSTTDEDPFTLNFEWLEREVQSLSGPSSNPSKDDSSGANLDLCLQSIQSTLEDKLQSSTPGLELLLETLNTTVPVEDVDEVSTTLGDFVTSLSHISVNIEDHSQPTACNLPFVSKILGSGISSHVFPPSAGGKSFSLSHIYDSLLKSWIRPLPETTPSRVRIMAEKNVREIALELYLAGLGVHVGSRASKNEVVTQEHPPCFDGLFKLPVRRKPSFQRLAADGLQNSREWTSSPLPSSQISKDTGFMPASTAALHTSEHTPSLRSKSHALSSHVSPEDVASRRLRNLVSLASQPVLPTSASNILRHWSEGIDPAMYDFEATESSLNAAILEPEDLVDEVTAKKRQRLENRLKRQRHRSIASSSQPEPIRLKESLPGPVPGSSRNENVQPSSQMTGRLMLSSQAETGAFGGSSAGGTGKGKGKTGKKRPPGFR